MIKKRSVDIAGHKTSVSLEAPFWDALTAIAKRRNMSINQLIIEIDKDRVGNLSSALRVYVLREAQTAINQAATA